MVKTLGEHSHLFWGWAVRFYLPVIPSAHKSTQQIDVEKLPQSTQREMAMKEDWLEQQRRGQECRHTFSAFLLQRCHLELKWSSLFFSHQCFTIGKTLTQLLTSALSLYSLCVFSTWHSHQRQSRLHRYSGLPLLASWWTGNLSSLSLCLLPSVCCHRHQMLGNIEED